MSSTDIIAVDLGTPHGQPAGLLDALPHLPLIVLAAIVIAALGLVLGAWAMADLHRRDRAAGGPAARRLARALGVSRRQRRVIERLARRAKLPVVAAAMVSEGCFDAMVSRTTASPREKIAVEEIRIRIFGRSQVPARNNDGHRG